MKIRARSIVSVKIQINVRNGTMNETKKVCQHLPLMKAQMVW
jgi:hypothetical protein